MGVLTPPRVAKCIPACVPRASGPESDGGAARAAQRVGYARVPALDPRTGLRCAVDSPAEAGDELRGKAERSASSGLDCGICELI